MYDITIKTDATVEPVIEATLKNFIKYDESETTETALITSLAKAAREFLEQYLNVSLASKTYQLTFDYRAVDDYHLRIPFGPVVSITSLAYYDIEGTETALTKNTDYYVRGLKFQDLYIPSLPDDVYFILEYVSGYGGTGMEDVPETIKTAICELTKYWYDRQEQPKALPDSIAVKVAPYSKQYFI